MTFAERWDALRDRISAAGGDLDRITVCAVTKGHEVAAVDEALAHGVVDLGENYAQELVAKATHLDGSKGHATPRWHFIGRLQRNKVKVLAPHVDLWQSVDRPELAATIARHAPGAKVLVQVATTGEEGKGGCPSSDVAALVGRARDDGLDVLGLMTVGPTDPGADPRPGFTRVRSLADRIGLPEVSMGMSRDLEAAVACGATIVRPGTALFGARPLRKPSER